MSKLQCISCKICQHLHQSFLVRNDGLGQFICKFHFKINSFGGCLVAKQVVESMFKLFETYILCINGHFSRFKPGQIENIVDQRQQCPRGFLDGIQVIFLYFSQFGFTQ